MSGTTPTNADVQTWLTQIAAAKQAAANADAAFVAAQTTRDAAHASLNALIANARAQFDTWISV